jgi:hypothetical protein
LACARLFAIPFVVDCLSGVLPKQQNRRF